MLLLLIETFGACPASRRVLNCALTMCHKSRFVRVHNFKTGLKDFGLLFITSDKIERARFAVALIVVIFR